MIVVIRPHTYHEVAAEIVQGLESGDVVLEASERDVALEAGETQDDLASFAWFALSFVHPAKISYTAPKAPAAGGPAVSGQARFTMEIGANELASLPSEIKHKFLRRLDELRGHGVQVDLRVYPERQSEPTAAGGII